VKIKVGDLGHYGIKVGDLVEDSHYGLGTVKSVGYKECGIVAVVRAYFPKMAHLNSGGHVVLAGRTMVRSLKVISRGYEKSEINLNIPE
jgi:hypothetical protein